MENFWDYKVWGTVNLVAVLLLVTVLIGVLVLVVLHEKRPPFARSAMALLCPRGRGIYAGKRQFREKENEEG